MAKRCAVLADELRATDIVILDVRTLCDVTDFFVICTGDNQRQLRAVQRRLASAFAGHRPRSEGEEQSSWVLLDFIDVVVHLFDGEAREFYDLELLWGDAPRVGWKPKAPDR